MKLYKSEYDSIIYITQYISRSNSITNINRGYSYIYRIKYVYCNVASIFSSYIIYDAFFFILVYLTNKL